MSDEVKAKGSGAKGKRRRPEPTNRPGPKPGSDEASEPEALESDVPESEDEPGDVIEEADAGASADLIPPEDVPADDPERKDFKALPPPTKGMSRKQLAEQYQPYVRSIAGKIKKTLSKEIEFDDLVGYGMLGLFEAADRYDAKFGANFMTFAYYRIRGAIYDGLRGMGWVSRTEYQRYRFEAHANQYLNNVHEQGLGVPNNVKKTSDDEVNDLANVVEGLVTIYVTALDAMEGFQIKDDRGPTIEESMEVLQARQLVAEAVQKLPEQEKKLLELYYYKELSLEEVGKHLGLSKSWTSRLHTRAIEKLGRLLRDLVSEYNEDKGGGAGHAKASGGRKSAQPAGPASR